MIFEKHSDLKGLHAPFSPSSPHWLNYDVEKAAQYLKNMKAKEYGTDMHDWAQRTINLGIKQPRSNKTIYKYVNDAIGFKMSTEVTLFYSKKFFGTADAISFKDAFLRIHDLKTGVNPGKMEQLMIYDALFCLEYKIKPEHIDGELRIYQADEIIFWQHDPERIHTIMNTIKEFDQIQY